MRTAAVIPVKRFANAKTRLGLSAPKVERLCSLMLKEILQVVSTSAKISHTFVVTGDEDAARMASMRNTTIIDDAHEYGVNEAVALADEQIIREGFDASIVIPQDIPYIKTQDIDFMMGFAAPPNFAIIVPSRKFDGTNALVRMPADLMSTHYDDDSYREHVRMANRHTRNAVHVFVRRIMMDLDTREDVEFLLANREKDHIAEMIEGIIKGPEQE